MTTDPRKPVVLVIAGPNGAGKSTAAPLLVQGVAHTDRYINADAIARGFSPFKPGLSAVTAGRLMIQHMRLLADEGASFALESTLSGLRLVNQLSELKERGYQAQLIYLWLPDVELAISRVQQRVELGGHSIPKNTIRRRYARSIDNLFTVYMPILDMWRVFDNAESVPTLIARGGLGKDTVAVDQTKWDALRASIGENRNNDQ